MTPEETPQEIQARIAAADRYVQVDYQFYDGLLNVKNGYGWGCIDVNENQIVPCRYKDKVYFDGEYARVNTGRHQYGLIDRNGREIIPCMYDNASGFDDEGFARYEKGIYWGTVDMEGKNHILPRMKFQQLGPFYNGIAPAKIDTKWGLVDTEGKHLTEFQYYEIDKLADGMYRVRIKPKLYNFLFPDGHHLFSCNFSYINEFDEQGFAKFYMEPTRKEKEADPSLKTKYGIAHISGIILYPPIFDHIGGGDEGGAFFGQVGTQGFFLTRDGRAIDANALLRREQEKKREEFFKTIVEQFPVTKKTAEAVLNWTMPGLQFFYRDTEEELGMINPYKVGDIIRAGDNLELTPMLYKPMGKTRFIIASAHAAPWYENKMNVEQDPNCLTWRLHYIHHNSYLKVLDIYELEGVTQIFMLHIPYRGIPLFMGNSTINLLKGEDGKDLVELARESLNNKIKMEFHETSLHPRWQQRTKELVGLDSRRIYYDIEYDSRNFFSPGLNKAIRRMANDEDEINMP